MNFDISIEIKAIQKNIQFPIQLEMQEHLSYDWASSKPDHRMFIRLDIVSRYSAFITSEKDVLDLKQIPKLSGKSISISHSESMAGYVVSNDDVGFDLVEIPRLKKNIIERVSSRQEIESAPRDIFLWVAKEASFKAIAKSQRNSSAVSAITDLNIGDWNEFCVSQNGTKIYSFRTSSEKALAFNHNRGFVFAKSDVLFSIYFF